MKEQKIYDIGVGYTYLSIFSLGTVVPIDFWYKRKRKKIIEVISEIDFKALDKFIKEKDKVKRKDLVEDANVPNFELIYIAYDNLRFMKHEYAVEFLKIVDVKRKNKRKSKQEILQLITETIK